MPVGTAETVGEPLQVSPVGSVKVMLPPVIAPEGRFAGSLIVMGLIAVVADPPKTTAGEFVEALYHSVLASVGTVKAVEAPNVP